MHLQTNKDPYVTVNPCRLCTPLGASLAFRGFRNCMPLIHGSQGCSTYIRRFLISHFREPMDIASSNFSEDTAIFGGENNLLEAISNVIKQYNPEIVGVATSCLTETIGDDVHKIIKDLSKKISCHLVAVSTPSFKGSHTIGFHNTIDAIVKSFCLAPSTESGVFIAPPIISPADLRYLKTQCASFAIEPVLLPDYSDTLDGGLWDAYTPLPPGGTAVSEIAAAGSPESTFIELGSVKENSTGTFLAKTFGTTSLSLPTPIGIDATDRFLSALSNISSKSIPLESQNCRKRCIDAYIDAHKYVGGVRTFIFGDEDIVPSIAAFCCEIGLQPILCASEGKFKSILEKMLSPEQFEQITIAEDTDFDTIEKSVIELKPDLMLGTGKGNHISIKYDIPLVRIGFPVHDRFGAIRQLHLGYEGAMSMLDNIVNILLSRKQENIPDGYSYL